MLVVNVRVFFRNIRLLLIVIYDKHGIADAVHLSLFQNLLNLAHNLKNNYSNLYML